MSSGAVGGGRLTPLTPLLLTKSLFKTAVTCPRKLVYATRPNLYPRRDASNPLVKNLAQEGKKFETYCRLQFPRGIVIGGGRPVLGDTNESIISVSGQKVASVEELVRETRSLLDRTGDNDNDSGRVTIFEGAVKHDNFFIRADILDLTGNDLRLIEVKAKSWDSSKSSGEDNPMVGKRGGVKSAFLPYIHDVAFQRMVIQGAFPHLNVTAHLMMPDKAVKTNLPNLNALVGTVQSEGSTNGDDGAGSSSYMGIDASEARALIADADEALSAIVDVTDLTDQVLEGPLEFPGCRGESFVEAARGWAEDVSTMSSVEVEDMAIPVPIGSHCKTCEYRMKKDTSGICTGRSGFNVCWREAAKVEESVLDNGSSSLVVDLWNGTKRDLNRFVSEGKYLLSDLSPADLGLTQDGKELKKKKTKNKKDDGKSNTGMSRSLRQYHQVLGVPSNSESERPAYLVDREYLTKEMQAWRFPFHFVDFETATPALPYSAGKAPFDTIAFQFSHHVLHEDGSIEHATQFLNASPGACPNGPFLRALGESVGGQDGTVFRWGVHENTVLSSLLRDESSGDLAPLLSGGGRAMVDLMQAATRGYYVEGSDASSSIKRLLLPTLRASASLEQLYGTPTYSSRNFFDMKWFQRDESGEVRDPYDLIAASDLGSDVVVDGGAAIAAYQVLQCGNLGPDARASLEASLLRYCELDTLAMAMIAQAWQGFLQE